MSKTVETLLLQASNARKRGDVAEAKRLYQSVLLRFPKNPRAIKALAGLPGSEPAGPAPATAPPLSEIEALVQLYHQGRFVEAAQAGEIQAARYPQSAVIFNALAAARAALKQFEAAAKAYERAIALEPGYIDAHFNLGNLLMELGRPAAAADSYSKALAPDPTNADVLYNLGNALRAQGRLDEAAAVYRRMLAINPEVPAAHNVLGLVLQELGDHEGAQAAYRHALALAPDDLAANTNLGNLQRLCGDVRGATVTFRRILTAHPDYPHGHNNLGIALQDLGDYEGAEASYRRALAIEPGHALAFTNLGGLLWRLARPDEAAEVLACALAIDPGQPVAHFNLGHVLVDLGRPAEAVQAYAKALAIRPDYPQALALKLHQQAHLCDWSAFAEFAPVADRLGIEGGAVSPFATLVFDDDPARNRKRSENFARETYQQTPVDLPPRPVARPRETAGQANSRQIAHLRPDG